MEGEEITCAYNHNLRCKNASQHPFLLIGIQGACLLAASLIREKLAFVEN
jgi:hypothetical protein